VYFFFILHFKSEKDFAKLISIISACKYRNNFFQSLSCLISIVANQNKTNQNTEWSANLHIIHNNAVVALCLVFFSESMI